MGKLGGRSGKIAGTFVGEGPGKGQTSIEGDTESDGFKQKGGGAGGASNAAGFLSRFVESSGKGWLHCDLAAAYNGNGNALWAAGATGQGIATITELVLNAKSN